LRPKKTAREIIMPHGSGFQLIADKFAQWLD
jgi:hypothetical protein